jgi:hypothetical protein
MAIRPRNRANSNRFNNLGINNNQNNANSYNNMNNYNEYNENNNQNNNNQNNNLNYVNNTIQTVQENIDTGVFTTLDDLFQMLKNTDSTNYKKADKIVSDLTYILINAPDSELIANFDKDELKELYDYRGALSMKRAKIPYYQNDLYERIQKLNQKMKDMRESGVAIPELLPKIMSEYVRLYREIQSSPSGGRRRKTRRGKSKHSRKTRGRRNTK